MAPSSFILEFHSHLTEADWRALVLAVGTAGATSRWLSSHRLELTCVKRGQLQHVGYIIFRVGVPSLCNVTDVSGEASTKASAYARASVPNPSFQRTASPPLN
jgi:hypothetical protein